LRPDFDLIGLYGFSVPV